MSNQLQKINKQINISAECAKDFKSNLETYLRHTAALLTISSISFEILRALPFHMQQKNLAGLLGLICLVTGATGVAAGLLTGISAGVLMIAKTNNAYFKCRRRIHLQHNPAPLPLTRTLVRASQAPTTIQQASLLRAAQGTIPTPPEQLLRAGRDSNTPIP